MDESRNSSAFFPDPADIHIADDVEQERTTTNSQQQYNLSMDQMEVEAVDGVAKVDGIISYNKNKIIACVVLAIVLLIIAGVSIGIAVQNSGSSAETIPSVEELKTVFEFCDDNHDHVLTFDEFKQGLELSELEAKKSDDELHKAFDAADKNGDNKLDFPEFASAFGQTDVPDPSSTTLVPTDSPRKHEPTRSPWRKVYYVSYIQYYFPEIDANNDNQISLEEFMDAVHNEVQRSKSDGIWGLLVAKFQYANDIEIINVFNDADINNDRKLNYEEFASIWLVTLSPETLRPATIAPETLAPETFAPQTLSPLTSRPQTFAPQTLEPETLKPATKAPETLAPQTFAPVTDIPTDVPTDTPTVGNRLEWGQALGVTNGDSYSLNADGINNKITGVRIREKAYSYIQSIQFQVNGQWQDECGNGGSGDNNHDLILQSNEYVNKVEISVRTINSMAPIPYLRFETNLGNSVEGGYKRGDSYTQGNGNKELVDFKGRYDIFLTQVQFQWK